MRKLFLDLETRSEVDIKLGPYAYAEGLNFQINIMAYQIRSSSSEEPDEQGIIEGHFEIIKFLEPHLRDRSIKKVAHNSSFERVVLSKSILPDNHYFEPSEWEDTMIYASWAGLPRALDKLARSLGVTPKMAGGKNLVKLFGNLRKRPRKNIYYWADKDSHPEDWANYKDYCIQDVQTMWECYKKMGSMKLISGAYGPTADEVEMFHVDQRIMDAGLPIDVPLAQQGWKAVQVCAGEANDALRVILKVDNPNSRDQFLRGMKDCLGLEMPDLTSETVQGLLDGDTLSDPQRQALELRQVASLASLGKYRTATEMVTMDGRLHGTTAFLGAASGRWAGRAIQLQNLPSRVNFYNRSQFEDVRSRTLAELPVTSLELKKMIRPLIYSDRGLTVMDYSGIEARMMAWLSGDKELIQSFIDGQDPYIFNGLRMPGIFPAGARYEDVDKNVEPWKTGRQNAKGAVLGGSYGGGVKALARQGVKGSTEEIQEVVDAFRSANRPMTEFWYSLDRAIRAIGEKTINCGQYIQIKSFSGSRDKAMVLPSGRMIWFRGVREYVREGRTRLSFQDPKGWREDIYGSKLSNYACQGTARDLLAAAMLRLDEAGIQTLGSVHDEVITDTREIERVRGIMCQLPTWAEGLPIEAEGFTSDRYGKDELR